MSNNIVAYIDLLAFSNHMRENTKDAVMAMNNYNTILYTKLRDKIIHPVSSYPEELKELAQRCSIDSFDFFIPYSDSVFLMSNDCNSFVKQLGSFVFDSYIITARFCENPIDSSKPEKGYVNNYSVNENGEILVNKEECNYYPALFRGGLAYGEAFPIDLYSVLNKKTAKAKIITGQAVIDAVDLEKEIKGPRLIFNQKVYEQLNDDTRDYCRITPECSNMYEILWPAFKYIKQRDPFLLKKEIDKMSDIIEPAYNLWKAYKHMPFSAQYFNFIEMIIASTIQFFDKKCNLKDFAKSKISNWINRKEIKDKINVEKY